MFLQPMLLQYADNNLPFNKPNHIAELKLDGIRLILSNMDQLKLYTRHNNDVTDKFPELHNSNIPQGTILDGELIVTDENGKPDFEAMMSRFQSKTDKNPVTFCVFDIMRYNGIEVTGLPLSKRKELLSKAVTNSKHINIVEPAAGSATDYFEVVQRFGLEGIVIKDLKSRYAVGSRSWSFQKVINWTYADVFISGYRKGEFGLLTSVIDSNGQYRPSGIIEFGVNPQQKQTFRSVRERLKVGENKQFVFLEPIIKAKVKTRNWTKNGMLRSPVMVDFIW